MSLTPCPSTGPPTAAACFDALAELLPDARLLDPFTIFASDAQWRRAWPRLVRVLGGFVMFGAEDGTIGAGCIWEMADAIAVGVPIAGFELGLGLREIRGYDFFDPGPEPLGGQPSSALGAVSTRGHGPGESARRPADEGLTDDAPSRRQEGRGAMVPPVERPTLSIRWVTSGPVGSTSADSAVSPSEPRGGVLWSVTAPRECRYGGGDSGSSPFTVPAPNTADSVRQGRPRTGSVRGHSIRTRGKVPRREKWVVYGRWAMRFDP